jgi:galactokinase
VSSALDRIAPVAQAFREYFGRLPTVVARAPGRVNLIGEHLDYNQGPVLPVAVDRDVVAAVGPSSHATVRAYAVRFQSEVSFRIGSHERGEELWSNYVRGVVDVLYRDSKVGAGFDLLVDGDVPAGAGLSSSAALELALAGAIRDFWRLVISNEDLALRCQRAENEFVGVQCGIMDQYAAALSLAGHALLIDCRTLDHEHVPFDVSAHGLALVVINSGVSRDLASSAYNRRREECAEAARLLKRSLPGSSLEEIGRLPEPLRQRARHVITETARVREAVDAARRADYEAFGSRMFASHESLRHDFEVSTPELDLLVELAKDAGALGSRLTGAGFGGSTVTLLPSGRVEALRSALTERYTPATGLAAELLVCRPSAGLSVRPQSARSQ